MQSTQAVEAAAAAEQPTAASAVDAASVPARSRASQNRAMLIQRVYKIDPLACPRCSGQMKVVAFIEPPQADVIVRSLRHCGLRCPSSSRASPAGDDGGYDPDFIATIP